MSVPVLLPPKLIRFSKVGASGEVLSFSIEDKELLADLSGTLEVNAMNSFKFEGNARQWGSNGLQITGEISCEVEQTCVVTLEPITTAIEAPFDRTFVSEAGRARYQPEIIDGEMVLDAEADDLPDILEKDEVDLWEVIIEELNLVIDPYPRSKNLDQVTKEDQKEDTQRPFADLKALINQKNKKN